MNNKGKILRWKSSSECVLYEILPPCVHWGLEPGLSSSHVSLGVVLSEREDLTLPRPFIYYGRWSCFRIFIRSKTPCVVSSIHNLRHKEYEQRIQKNFTTARMLKLIFFYETKQVRKSQYNVAMFEYVCYLHIYECVCVCVCVYVCVCMSVYITNVMRMGVCWSMISMCTCICRQDRREMEKSYLHMYVYIRVRTKR